MTQAPPRFADVELYADEPAAVAALQPPTDKPRQARPSLPEWATAPEVADIDGVTVLRPSDEAIRYYRPGLRYRDLIRHHGRDRLVLNMAGLRPFGHPFRDDIFLILAELGIVGGRFAICRAVEGYVGLLGLYRFIRIVQSKAVE